jgi:FtsZ-interacting cell division protein ZipA
LSKPVEKVATPVKPTRHPRVSKKAEPVASSPVSAPNSNIALPQGATLIVGVPNDNTKAYIERKSRREDNETLSIVKKDGFKAPDKKAPADRPSRKPAPSKKAEAPKKPEQPKKSVPAKKTASPKKPAAAKAPKASNKKPVSPVAKEDKNLNAKINNPNYPVADKIADLKAQLAVVKGLSSDEQKGLYFPANKLEEKIAELSKK